MNTTSGNWIELARANGREVINFDYRPDAKLMQQMQQTLELNGLRKARINGTLTPVGKEDWHLAAVAGATAVQDCVVTLDPVTTRIDEAVSRTFVANYQSEATEEQEMTQDETVEPLPTGVDLLELLTETLALALPAFPRSEGAKLDEMVITAPGITPMTDEVMKPFAGLKDLRDKLANKEE